MNDLTYIDESGNTVFTSAYLRKRGTCCKTNCLHCPFGHTLKNHSIKLIEMKEVHIKYANEIIRDTKPIELSDLSQSILSSAFGKKKIRIHYVSEENLNNFAFGEFKNVICAIVEFSNKLSESSNGKAIKNLYLKKEFQDQGLDIEHIEKTK